MKKHVFFGARTGQVGLRFSRVFGLFLLLAGLAFVAGCGGKTGDGEGRNEVTGKVTLGDKPVAGTVVFVSAGGKETLGPILADGQYMMPDVPVGQVKVYIKAPTGGAGIAMPKGSPELPKDTVAGGGVPPPLKYQAAGTSGLTYEVKAGKQTHDIPLSK